LLEKHEKKKKKIHVLCCLRGHCLKLGIELRLLSLIFIFEHFDDGDLDTFKILENKFPRLIGMNGKYLKKEENHYVNKSDPSWKIIKISKVWKIIHNQDPLFTSSEDVPHPIYIRRWIHGSRQLTTVNILRIENNVN
jgi:hypothetical protein